MNKIAKFCQHVISLPDIVIIRCGAMGATLIFSALFFCIGLLSYLLAYGGHPRSF